MLKNSIGFGTLLYLAPDDPGVGFYLNYNRLLLKKGIITIEGQSSLGLINLEDTGEFFYTLEANCLVGKHKHFLNTGIGIKNYHFLIFIGTIGYTHVINNKMYYDITFGASFIEGYLRDFDWWNALMVHKIFNIGFGYKF